jgi:hypothetical protein
MLLLTTFAEGAEPGPFRAGPIWDKFPLTLSPGERTEAAGPFFYQEQNETRQTWAFSPLLSYSRDTEVDMEEFDLAYPVLTYDRYGGQYRWQFCQLFSFAGGPSQTETNRNRFTLFPIYFQQRSSDSNETYTSYGPFYGHLNHRLMRDEIDYVLFPFYTKTRKKDVVTRNYVYPFVHLREGTGLSGWQVFPFLGHEHKEVTTRTNGFGDLEIVPGHDRRFLFWPIYSCQISGSGTTNLARQQTFLPAYSTLRSPARDSTTVLWPFFSRIDDREKDYREWQVPWPLIEFARGPGKYATRLWPFYSHATNAYLESSFFLWPIYKVNRVHAEGLDRTRTRIAFFLYSDTIEKHPQTSEFRRQGYMWPFFIYRRDLHGSWQLRVLAPLEPLIPGAHKVERDYSPLWSVWRAEHNQTTGAESQSLLWNLYRHDVRPGSRKLSVFFGAYQSEQTASLTTRKLLFIPLGKKPAHAAAPSNPSPAGRTAAAASLR